MEIQININQNQNQIIQRALKIKHLIITKLSLKYYFKSKKKV